MARQPRVEYPDALYHVMARGDRKADLFRDDRDRETFLRTVEEAVERSGWQVLAWVLVSHHYHLVIRTPDANLVAGMKWLQNTYTRRVNTRHGEGGPLFGGRYKAIPVEGTSEGGKAAGSDYLATVLDYVHLDPARAMLVSARKKQSLMDYPWSSLHRDYPLPKRSRKPWMNVGEGLALFGFRDDSAGRRRFVERLEQRAREHNFPAGVDKGWYLGDLRFREKLLKLVEKADGNRNDRSSAVGKAHARQSGEQWIGNGRRHFRLTLPATGREQYRERVAVAWAVHRKTNQPQEWIAQQLGLHTAANVSQQVRRFQRERMDEARWKMFPPAVKAWIREVET